MKNNSRFNKEETSSDEGMKNSSFSDKASETFERASLIGLMNRKTRSQSREPTPDSRSSLARTPTPEKTRSEFKLTGISAENHDLK